MSYGAKWTPKKKLVVSLTMGITLLMAGSVFAWLALRSSPTPVKIPQEISNKLLFTPYVPSALPKGYIVQPASFSYKEGALLFSSRKIDSSEDTISISEQSVPKSFDIDGFYSSTIKNPVRLRGTPHATVFGMRADNSGTIAGITTSDNTWILISSSTPLQKGDIKRLVAGLVPQQ